MRASQVDPRVLTEAGDPAGVARLLGHLGYDSRAVSIPREVYPQFGLNPAEPEPRALHRVARHRDLAVLLLEVGDPADRALARRLAARLHHHNRGVRRLLVFADPGYERLVFATARTGPGSPTLRFADLRRREPRRADLEVLADLSADESASATELALRHAQALDRDRVTRRFYQAIRRVREALAAAWTGVPARARRDRRELALLTLNRLLFLVFLQQKGWLDGDRRYLRRLCERVTSAGGRIYRDAVRPLFFGALNTRPRDRGPAARGLGTLPFLNGGLFEAYAVERRHPDLDAPDEPFSHLIHDVFERHRFTVQEDTPLDHDAAVDPEMLGRVFEGLMHERVRAAHGAFYTPTRWVAQLVDAAFQAYLEEAAGLRPQAARALLAGAEPELDPRARRRALEALRRVRVLDPAVGSGAFLLAALHRIEALVRALEPPAGADAHALRQQIVHENLYGVDRNGSAVRLCELRLWLALVVDLDVAEPRKVPPLPNLDHKIRQGDTLIDPLDVWTALAGAGHLDVGSEWRRGLRALESTKARYLHATGRAKQALGRALRATEARLARRMLDRLLRRAEDRLRELGSLRRSRDLFGVRGGRSAEERAALRRAHRARRDLREIARRLVEEQELPFFSTSVHFAEVRARGGFDLVLGNPPWVRPHRVPGSVREALRARYAVARDAVWVAGAALSGAGRGFGSQVDLAAVFVERGLELLRPAGVLAFWLPVKLAQALYAGGLRARLLANTSLLRLDDLSRRSSAPFQAVTFPLGLVCRKEPPARGHRVEIARWPPRGPARIARLPQRRLPLWTSDAAAPWCLVPAGVRRAVARMVDAGPPLARAGFAPARGIVTGANSVFCVGRAEFQDDRVICIHREGDRAKTRVTEDLDGAEVEAEALRPLLKGEDIRAWRARPSGWVIFPHDPTTGRPWARLPPRLARHLAKHEATLRRRKDLRPGDPFWTLFRVRPAKLGPCVAWRDLGRRLEAVALPGLPDGAVPLNTVYLIPVSDPERACALAALLNSAIVSAFLTAYAERAATGFHRFFAWTVGCLPLPGRWCPMDRAVARLSDLGAAAHAPGAPAEVSDSLEAAVAELYGLTEPEVRRLHGFQPPRAR